LTYICFATLKTYLAESRRIPLRLTKFDGLTASNCRWFMRKRQLQGRIIPPAQ